jgi:flagellar motor switch protein FliG
MAAPKKTIRDAAVLLRSLPATQRVQLLDRLDLNQAAAVAAAMNELDELDDAEQKAVVQEFSGARSVPQKNRDPQTAAPFEFLHDLDTDALLGLIGDEHPQTIAFVLSYLPPLQAGPVLAGLSAEQQFLVVCRIATMSDADPAIVGDVENALKRRMFGVHERSAVEPGVASAVKILNAMEPAAERKLLAALTETDPRLVGEIRRAMFGADVTANADWSMADVVT